MIQRIQSLFLLAVLICSSILLFVPLATLNIGDTISEYYISKVVQLIPQYEFLNWNYPSLILNCCIGLLALVTIMLYKKRFLQMRLCLINIFLNIGMAILVYVQTTNIEADWNFAAGSIIPIINIILLWMSMHSIAKDIKLLKSLDRIR